MRLSIGLKAVRAFRGAILLKDGGRRQFILSPANFLQLLFETTKS